MREDADEATLATLQSFDFRMSCRRQEAWLVCLLKAICRVLRWLTILSGHHRRVGAMVIVLGPHIFCNMQHIICYTVLHACQS